jgi:hypothetical protein
MFTLIKQSCAMYEQIRADAKEKSAQRKAEMTPEQRVARDAKVQMQVDCFFEYFGLMFKAVPHILLFCATFWLAREISYQRYSYFRTRYRDENGWR